MESQLGARILDDLKSAMRAGDTGKRDVIRYLRSAMGNREIELRRDLTDEDILAVIRTQIKQSSDAAEIFRDAGRIDLAEKEEAQVEILKGYLPAQLSDEELTEMARSIIAEQGLSGPGDMSKLMPEMMKQAGDRADGRRVSQIARQELQSAGG